MSTDQTFNPQQQTISSPSQFLCCCFATREPHSGWRSIRVASREAQSSNWDGRQDGREASSFTSYMRFSQVTLCESVRLDVAGKRSFDGCGFRSGCPVASAHSCDTLNHAAITRTQISPWAWLTYTHTQTCLCTYKLSCFNAHINTLPQTAA